MSEVARMTETPTGTIHSWYHNGTVPNAHKLARFGKRTGTNLHWLLTGDGPTKAPGYGTTAADAAFRMGRREVLTMIKTSISEIEARVMVAPIKHRRIKRR
jgi:hypothetical protein